jgi:phospholipid/cholesterol/gamma-HCH transport system substrate-binding protein
MENSARIAGYTLVLTILGGLLILILAVRDTILFPNNRVQVRFPTVGTLMEDDPVKLHGVEVGRVIRIEAGEGAAIATLELYSRTPLTKQTRFINFNYSMFGARMIILVPGKSTEPLDRNEVQQGDFSAGVTETIHRVDALLKTVMEYQALAARLEKGNDSSLSLQALLVNQVYPALEDFGNFSKELELLELETESDLEALARAGGTINRFSASIATSTDSMVVKANRTLEQLTLLTAQSTVLLHGLEKLMIAAQDSTTGPGRILTQREIYDRTLTTIHTLQDLLKLAEKDGLKDAIHFWRNVHVHLGKPATLK